ncbi:MAG TPA: YraN family protein [Actinomycetota bacterium]|nr:YraN family protein [Actinomycetota bacterium]
MASSTVDRRPARGREGEDAALRVYLRRGYTLVARNWRCALGELDLVLERAGVLVVCEVKTRTGAAFGGGYEAVTWAKRRKLRRLAEAFLVASRQGLGDVRFDVASVWLGPRGPDVEVFEDAF